MNHHPLGSFQFLVDRAIPPTNLEKPCLSTGFLNFIDHRRQGWSDLANLGEMMHQASFLAEGVSTLLECGDITHWLSDESIWYLHHFSICFPIAFIHIVCCLEFCPKFPTSWNQEPLPTAETHALPTMTFSGRVPGLGASRSPGYPLKMMP